MDKILAYKEAEAFAKSHYENFPVVSFLIPKNLRKHIAIIYWFARTADDIADEGTFTQEERINRLNIFEARLTDLLKGKFKSSYELALYSTICERNLSSKLFFDLLKAFKQDAVKKKYSNFNGLLKYCEFSANPIGRLILQLNDIRNDKALYYSDNICTALQFTNFYQDTEIDTRKERFYYPMDEMQKYGVTEKSLLNGINNLNFQNLLKSSITRAEEMLNEGKGILNYLKGRLKFEINWTILGGEAILHKIKFNNYMIFNNRPKINKFNSLYLLIKALF